MTHATGASLRAREAVLDPLARAADQFPELQLAGFHLTYQDLPPREAALAQAIHQTVLERWITLEHLLDQFLRQPCRLLEPSMRAIFLAGAAQLLFLSHAAPHAVVHESVEIARRRIRPGAAGMVNAVLRRIAELTKTHHDSQPWRPAVNALPIEGGWIELTKPCLPDPTNFVTHHAIATSHPPTLVRRWLDAFGDEQARALCLHSLTRPPTIVAVEDGFQPSDVNIESAPASTSTLAQPSLTSHAQPGFFVWRGDHAALKSFLAAHRARRVQDPTAAHAVAATRCIAPKTILDFCAGRGTKTRQLLITHPEARIDASDRDRSRLDDLSPLNAQESRLRVISPSSLDAALPAGTGPRPGPNAGRIDGPIPAGGIDLLVLDVPCTNTGVLARRLEARYRFNGRSVESLVELQQNIISASLPFVKRGGHVLYTTCSLEERENQEQVRERLLHRGATLLAEELTLPSGHQSTYHDGGYFALIKLRG